MIQIQMDMIETRQNIDQQIRKYVKDLMSVHRYEEAQWVHEIFEADETQRLVLEDAAMEQKQKKEEAEEQRQKLLGDWARLECECRKKEAVEKAKGTQAKDSSTHGMSQATPNQASANAAQNMPIAPVRAAFSWADEMNDLADIQYPGAKAFDNNLAPYFDPATGRMAIPADYRPPGTASHHTWMDSKDPDVFNKNLFFVENGAHLEAAARPAMPFYMVVQIYNKMCFDGNLVINTLDLIEKRMYRENALCLSMEKMKMVDEAQRAVLAPPTEPALRRKTWAQNFRETPQHGIQNVLQQTGGNTTSIPCEITAEGFMDYVQNHITDASFHKYYEAFLTKEYLIRSPNGHPIVSFKHYKKDFRGQLTRMADRIINQAQHMGCEYERQLFYHSHLESASIRGIWKDAAQALNQLEKTMFQTQQLRAGVHSRQVLIGVPHPLYQQPSSVNSKSSTGLHAIGGRRSSITSFTLDDNMEAIHDSDCLNPQEELFQAPIFEDNKPNHEDKLRLLQALADQATRRATSPTPAQSHPPLAAAPVLVVRYQQKSDVPRPEHEKIYMGNVFGWHSIYDELVSFPGMTNQEYIHHLQKYHLQRKDASNQQRGGPRRNPSSPGAVGQGRESAMAAQVQAQNVIDNVLSGAADDGHKVVNPRIQTHQPDQQAMSPHAQARMPVENIHQQQQHPRRKPKSRGLSAGSHLVPPPGVGSTKPRTPSMLGQYAITAETTPEKEMHDKVVFKMPQIVADDSTQVADTTAPVPSALVCSPGRGDSVMNSKPKVETALANGTGMEPEGGVKLPQVADDIIQEADTTVSESPPLVCSPTREDSVMELRGAGTALIQEAPKMSQWVEMPMPHIVSDSSKDGAPVVDTTAPAPSEAARFSLLFYDNTKAGSARLHYSDTREDAVSFAVTDALHRGLNPITAPSKAAIGFSSDSLTDEEMIKAVKPLMPFLCSSDGSMETIKKALTAAVDAVAEGVYPLTYLYEFIRFTTVAPPRRVIGTVASSKPKVETPGKTPVKTPVKTPIVKTPIKTPVKTLMRTPVTALRISSVAAGNVSMPTNSSLSPMAPAFIPSPKSKGPTMCGNRVASSPVAKSPGAASSFTSGSFMNQPSSPLRIQEHIDSIVGAAGSPLDLQERILIPAAKNLASLSPGGLKLRGPFSLPAQQVRFPGSTPFNTPVKGSKAEVVAENEKSQYQTPTKGPKLGSRSVSLAGGSLRDPGKPQTPTKRTTVESRSVSMTGGSLRDPGMPQRSPAPKPNDAPTRPKMTAGPFVKEDTRYYKTPTKGGLVASRVASFGGGNARLPLVSGGSPGQARVLTGPQGVEMPHNGGVSETIAAAVENIKRAMQQNPGLESLTQLIPLQNSNSAGPTASGKVEDGQSPTGPAAAQKLPPKQKGLSRSKWASQASAPKGHRLNVANRNRPLRGPHADALAMFEDLQSHQRAPGGTGTSEPPMVKSKSSFNLDVEMTDAPQADVTATVPTKNSTGLHAMWAASLPQASEPDARCDAIKRNLSENPDLTDPKWCPQHEAFPTTPPAQRPSPRVTFPTTPPAQRPSPLNIDQKHESHGFRRERAESFSQTSPVFRNETKYGPPRLKGLAVRLPKESHASPRSRRPPGVSSPLSPHPTLNQREGNASPKRNKLMEKLNSPAKQTPVPRLPPPPLGLLPRELPAVHEETRHAVGLLFNNVKTDVPAAVRAQEALLDEIAALSLAELLRGIKNADTDLQEVADDGERQGLIKIRGYLEHEYSKRQLVVRAQEAMMDEVAVLSLTELQQVIKDVDVKLQKENDDDERQGLTERRGYLDHELSKRELEQELAETQADIIRMAEEINAAHPGRVTLPDFAGVLKPVPELPEATRRDTTDLFYNFPPKQVALQRVHQAKLAGDAAAKLKAQSSAPTKSSMSDADRARKPSIEDSRRKMQDLKAAEAKVAAGKAAAAQIDITQAYIPAISESISVDALESTLSAFGQVMILYFNRYKSTALVEFATPEQYQAAFDANPHKIGEDTIRVEPRRPENGPNVGSLARLQSLNAAGSNISAKSSAKGHTSAPAINKSAAIPSKILAKEAVVASGKLKIQTLRKVEEKAAQKLAPKPKVLADSKYADTSTSDPTPKGLTSSQYADAPAQGFAFKGLSSSTWADQPARVHQSPTQTAGAGRGDAKVAEAKVASGKVVAEKKVVGAPKKKRLESSKWADQPAQTTAPKGRNLNVLDLPPMNPANRHTSRAFTPASFEANKAEDKKKAEDEEKVKDKKKVVAVPKKKGLESSKEADKPAEKPAQVPASLSPSVNLSGLSAIEQTIARLEQQKSERTGRGLLYSPTGEIMDEVRRNRLRATLSEGAPSAAPSTPSEATPPAPGPVARPGPAMVMNADGQILYFDLQSAAGPHGGAAYKTREEWEAACDARMRDEEEGEGQGRK